jgi:hypothetical protein
MAKHLSWRDEQKRQDAQGYWMAGVAVAGLAAGGVWVLLNQAPARDKLTGCLKSGASVHLTAIVDRSDPKSATDRAVLRSSMINLADKLAAETRLTLTPFGGAADSVPAPLFDRCKPKSGKEVDPVFATTARADQALVATFSAPVGKAIDELAQSTSATSTNLVQFIATTAALGQATAAGQRRFRVYSDMAEHTATGSLIGKKPLDAAGFAKYFSERVGTRLKGVELEIVVIPSVSTPAATAKRIKTAWTAALTANNITFTFVQLGEQL